MKKTIILLAVAVLGIAGLPSCKKEKQPQPPITTNLNITLKQNQAYTFTMPANGTPLPYKITSQAAHYSISTVGKDANGNEVYQYTPELNYTGTDKVTINNLKEEGGSCGNGGPHPHGGPCGGHHGNDHDEDDIQPNIVNISFNIGTSVNNTERSTVSITPSF